MRSFWLSSSWVLCAWRCFFFAAESALALLLEPQAGANNSLGVGLVFSWRRRRRRFFSLLFKPAGNGGEWLSIRSWTDLGLEVGFFGGRTVESGVHRPSADGLLWSCCCICGDLVRFINAACTCCSCSNSSVSCTFPDFCPLIHVEDLDCSTRHITF
jgi:hypothetical protein